MAAPTHAAGDGRVSPVMRRKIFDEIAETLAAADAIAGAASNASETVEAFRAPLHSVRSALAELGARPRSGAPPRKEGWQVR